MSISTLLIIILILAVVGAFPAWPHSTGWGSRPAGLIALVLILVLFLMLAGKL